MVELYKVELQRFERKGGHSRTLLAQLHGWLGSFMSSCGIV